MRWQSVVYGVLVALLFISAVLLTVLRFTQPGWGPAVRAVGFTPYAVPLYFLVFLLLLVPLMRRTTGRRLVGALTLLSLAGVATHISLLWPEFTGDSARPGQGEQEFRVMTANLFRGEADAQELVKLVAEQRVTTLVLEEVTPEALAELEEAGLDEALPFRAGEPGPGTTGTMVFSDFRLRPIARLETDWGSWAVEAIMPQGPLRMYAVHARPPKGDADEWADDLNAVIDAAKADRDVDLILGDLNATPDHWALQDLEELDFRRATERANSGWKPTWPDHWEQSWFGIPLPLVVQIDHVLAGRSIAVLAANTAEVEGGDHRAVIAEVAFR